MNNKLIIPGIIAGICVFLFGVGSPAVSLIVGIGVFLVFFFIGRKIKSKKGSTVDNSMATHTDGQSRLDQEYRSRYGSEYDIVLRYNDVIAHTIGLNNLPKYAVDWLAEAIENGVQIEEVAIYESIEKGFPYLCETEQETWTLTKEDNPIIGSAEGIYDALLQYKYGNMANIHKLNYWTNRLLELARNGNYMAQGLLCWRRGIICHDSEGDGIIPKEEGELLLSRYEEKLLEACENGVPYAQLAVAKYHVGIDDEKKKSLYLSAIESGLSDACFYYAQFLNMKRYEANNMTVNCPEYGTVEWEEYMHDELSLYKKGAEFNNGVMTGYCQFRLGDMYACGDGGVLKDESMAQYWFKKSIENGYYSAKYRIET